MGSGVVKTKPRIVGISDVSIGYGSPEVPALMDSICRTFGTSGLLIEPDEISRPPVKWTWDPAFKLERIASIFPDHTPAWHRHFQSNALRKMEAVDPDILVIFGSSVFTSLMGLRKRPKCIIYHAYEFISSLGEHDKLAHEVMIEDVDLVITPEIERLIIDVEGFKRYPEKVAAIYNVADISYPDPVISKPADQRNGRILWFGTLHRTQAYADHFLSPSVADIGFDLFGRITDPDPESLARKIEAAQNLRYFGVAPAEELNARRAEAAFSLVWWNPEMNAGAYYLASNRFFCAVQAAVPPICGPHPQCVDLIHRYGCGLIMPDWSLPSFEATVRDALALYKTPAYAEMVENCAEATRREFNWGAQYDRIKHQLVDATGLAQVA